jgi:ribosomal-protein-alanine N-acetyltransferase
MIRLLQRLIPRKAPILAEATGRDVAAIAALHAQSFHRGWSEDEVEALLHDRSVLAQTAISGRKLAGFILSRIAADEAEILSVAVAPAWRGRHIGRDLLRLHLRRLAGFGVESVFLEVGERNDPAQGLYAASGFYEVGRRARYYAEPDGKTSDALILRRDLI